jgi:hypothetical protein
VAGDLKNEISGFLKEGDLMLPGYVRAVYITVTLQ